MGFNSSASAPRPYWNPARLTSRSACVSGDVLGPSSSCAARASAQVLAMSSKSESSAAGSGDCSARKELNASYRRAVSIRCRREKRPAPYGCQPRLGERKRPHRRSAIASVAQQQSERHRIAEDLLDCVRCGTGLCAQSRKEGLVDIVGATVKLSIRQPRRATTARISPCDLDHCLDQMPRGLRATIPH